MEFIERIERGGGRFRKVGVRLRIYLPPAAVLILFIVGLATSIYTVPADSEAVIRRFGRYIRTTGPGIHTMIPFWIETAAVVPVRRIQKEEFGFRTLKAGVKSEYLGADNVSHYPPSRLRGLLKDRRARGGDIRSALREELKSEYLVLTGDLNVADVEWVVQYRIKDPVAYLFNVRDETKTVRDLSQAAMRRVVGDASVDEVITIGRVEIENAVSEMLQDVLDRYQTGIKIVALKLQSVNPPMRVRPAFNEVNEAKQDKERLVNEAWRAYNEKIPRARGEAEKMVKEAEAYAIERVNRARGDASKFKSIFEQYRKAREVTERRLYLEALAEMLPRLSQIWVIEQKGAEGGILQQLRLEGEEK